MSLLEFRGRFTIGNSNANFKIGVNALTMSLGDHYIRTYDGESTNQAVENMQEQIRKVAGQGNANVTYEASSGLVNIVLNISENVEFVDAALGTLLGFGEPTSSNALYHTASRQPRYVWRPGKAPSDHPVDQNVFWAPRSTTVAGRAPTGATYTVPGVAKLYDAVIEFRHLPDSSVITPGTGTAYADLQQFFEDVIDAGEPIRILPCRTVNTLAGTKTAIWGTDDDEAVGSLLDYIGRHLRRYNGLWDVQLPLMKDV